MLKGLKQCGIPCVPPAGTFYLFPDISGFGSSKQFANFLLNKARVSVVPGDEFGTGGGGHVRMHFAASMEELKLAINSIKHALSGP